MSEKTRYPFTNNQWQELEHQALIFKYMISGMQIPHDLLLSVKRSMDQLSLSSSFFPHQSQQYGWNCLQMGLGGRIDPEPGRCRRTDGKKWRCSKEAHTDSKYCERHMHRGKSRSRKPVEINHNPSPPFYKNPISSPSSMTLSSSINKTPPAVRSYGNNNDQQNPCYGSCGTSLNHHSIYHQDSPSSSRVSSGIGLSSQNNTTRLFFDSNSYAQTDADYRYRYAHGLKEDVNEHLFFSEPLGSPMEDSCHLAPLTISTENSLSHSQQRNRCETQGGYSCNLTETPKNERKTHHFFDERPLKNKDSWLNLDDSSSICSSVSNTQLSISVPTPSHDFPIFNSRTRNDG